MSTATQERHPNQDLIDDLAVRVVELCPSAKVSRLKDTLRWNRSSVPRRAEAWIGSEFVTVYGLYGARFVSHERFPRADAEGIAKSVAFALRGES